MKCNLPNSLWMYYLLSKVPILPLWQGILDLCGGVRGRNRVPRGSVSGILLLLPEQGVVQIITWVPWWLTLEGAAKRGGDFSCLLLGDKRSKVQRWRQKSGSLWFSGGIAFGASSWWFGDALQRGQPHPVLQSCTWMLVDLTPRFPLAKKTPKLCCLDFKWCLRV